MALRTVWGKSKIDEIAKRLDMFRIELVLRVVVSLKLEEKFRSVREDKRFQTLEEGVRRIAESFLDNKNFFTKGITDVETAFLTQQHQERSDAQKRHEETIAAIATFRGFGSQSVTGTTWSSETFSDELRNSSIRDLRDIQMEVLEFLAFRHMIDRRAEIAPHHQHTFQWIYQDTKSRNESQADLGRWLQHGNGCYWVSGKAGCGKSTLMKYISEEPRTKMLLSKWASEEPLLCASFYFWNSGTSLQKSQSGLLRSVLYDALRKHPELIPIVFPGLCRAISRGRLGASGPSLPELKNALAALTTQEVLPLRICFFIDGIDEYDGDHTELANLLLSIASSMVKIVLSSRPTPACVEAFSSCPRLQLHDLTKPDIYLYVRQNVMAHSRMLELNAKTSDNANLLVTEIVRKASGVFLWVVLVVKSLLTGFRDYDEIEVLHQRLDELPSDLENLYRHMMNQMKPFYRERASRLLQIMYRCSRMPRSQPLTLLRLSLADEHNPDAAIEADIKKMSSEEKLMRCKEMESRIRSRCCGLLEVRRSRGTSFTAALTDNLQRVARTSEPYWTTLVTMSSVTSGSSQRRLSDLLTSEDHLIMSEDDLIGLENSVVESENILKSFKTENTWINSEDNLISSEDNLISFEDTLIRSDDDLIQSEVHFLHQSVIDFLEMPEIWNSLVILTSTTNFDANVSIACSTLFEMKAATEEYNTPIDESLIWSFLVRGLEECAAAEDSTNQAQDLLLDEYDSVMDFHWRKIQGWIPRYGLPFNEVGHWSNLVPSAESQNTWSYGGPRYDSMFSVTCRFGLKVSVKRVLERGKCFSPPYSFDHGNRAGHPNFAQTALNRLVCDIPAGSGSEPFWDNAIEILKLSLHHGGDPNLVFYDGRSPWQVALFRFNPLSLIDTEQWAELLEILLRGGANPNIPCLLDIFNYMPNNQDVRIWQSPLAVLKERYRETVTRTDSNTAIHKINGLWERQENLLIRKGGVFNEWAEIEKRDWNRTRPGDRWEKVIDPLCKDSIFKLYVVT